MNDFKIINTLKDKKDRSRLDTYWQGRGFKAFYKLFRRGVDLPKSLLKLPNNSLKVQEKYNLRGFQFGNWLSIEDRWNYLAAFFVCFYDLNKVLKFKNNNLGLDKTLGVSFGARGSSNAVAHYESWSHIINVTRYKDIKGVSKQIRFKNTGGAGAIAHEYGHFLDYYFGANHESHSSIYSLTGGNSTKSKRTAYPEKYKMRNLVEDIMEVAFLSQNKKEPSRFYLRIRNFSEKKYFVQRNEIFARLFEQYVSYKLKKIGINNQFLTDTKYNTTVYMKTAELEKVVPLFDKLIVLMRSYF